MTIGTLLGFSDTTVSPATGYSYRVSAVDASGNESPLSPAATVTPPPGTPGATIFSDGFESGGLTLWTTANGLVVQQQEVYSQLWGARGTTSGTLAYALTPLSSLQLDLYFRVRFKLNSRSTTVNLLKFRSDAAGNTSLLTAHVSTSGRLGYKNDVTGVSTTGAMPVSLGVWHTLQVHVRINGAAGETETWFDGVRQADLSKTESLGTTPIGRIQIGDSTSGHVFDVAFDDVVAATTFIEG